MNKNKTDQTRRESTGETIYRFKAEVKKTVEVLGLKWTPIAGKFSVNAKGIIVGERMGSVSRVYNPTPRRMSNFNALLKAQ